MVRYFKDMCDDLVEGIKLVYSQMEKEEKLNENTTFEEVAKYAGQHVLISEKKVEK